MNTPHTLRLGAHVSAAGGLVHAIARIRSLDGTAAQVFTRNQRTWRHKPLTREETEAFRVARAAWGPWPVFAHAAYLINLASPKPDVRVNSVAALAREVTRCAVLGLEGVVLHPGSPGMSGAAEDGTVAAASEIVARGLDEALAQAEAWLAGGEGHADVAELRPGVTVDSLSILLENTAGAGAALGSRFEELGVIISASRRRERLAVCLDTCHAFAAGYDMRDVAAVAATVSALEEGLASVGGLDRLALAHLNDSREGLGEHKDRHAAIGAGAIVAAGFAAVLANPALRRVPMVIETPKAEKQGAKPESPDLLDMENLETLRRLAA